MMESYISKHSPFDVYINGSAPFNKIIRGGQYSPSPSLFPAFIHKYSSETVITVLY